MSTRKHTAGALALALAAIAGVASLNATAPSANAQSSDRTSQQEKQADRPTLIAIKVHADWCGTCRAMAPSLAEARELLKEESILFYTADRTDSENKQAELFFGAFDLDEMWFKVGKRTGAVHLVDPSSKEIVATLTGSVTRDSEELARTIKRAIPRG